MDIEGLMLQAGGEARGVESKVGDVAQIKQWVFGSNIKYLICSIRGKI